MKTQNWHVEPDQATHGCQLCIMAGDEVIARTPGVAAYGHPEQARDEAKAKLLAAAPALLKALRAILPYAQEELYCLAELGKDCDDTKREAEEAERIIEEAEEVIHNASTWQNANE